jgi:prepilin-type N-terminal cleavage/methylation domain-containing protein
MEMKRAFTLIELLVVIVIIAVLMGLAFPVFQSIQNQAKKTQAKNDVTQIVTAVNAFYTEYGKYPIVTADTIYGPAGTSTTNNTVLDVLRAKNNTENPRQIIFISPPDAKNPSHPRSGIGTATGAGQYFDPWGFAYNIAIDGNYDNQLANPYSSGAGNATLQIGVIAWSSGADGASNSAADKNSGKNKDDVISWL